MMNMIILQLALYYVQKKGNVNLEYALGGLNNCRLAFYMKLIINNIIKINEESPSNNLTIF